jgi:uncharacterized protein (TIGR02301 family)
MRGALIALLLMAAPAAAQVPLPPREGMVRDLSYVMGQSHALRQICRGKTDQYWRARMRKLIELESAAGGATYTDHFNAGFKDAFARFPTCSITSKLAERRAAENGRALANLLARSEHP